MKKNRPATKSPSGPIANLGALIVNEIVSRTAWVQKWLNPLRNIEQECGHPPDITIEDYWNAFDRGDIAARVVSLYPDECWSENPMIYQNEDEEETEFDKAWNSLQEKFQIYSILHRSDVLSGIGRFGVILLGINDGKPLREIVSGISETGEVTGSPKYDLLYVRPFDETHVKVKSLEEDVSNPRFGMPKMYEIQFNAEAAGNTILTTPQVGGNLEVHWSRIIHLTDNRASSDTFGMPRLKKVFNRILDLKKVAGGSGEMFWKGGFPGLALETPTADSQGNPITIDLDSTKEQVEAYMNGLQRYLAVQGMGAKSLSVQVADPTPHVDVQVLLICVAMGVPKRVFLGAEVGQLASGQDIVAWNKRLNRRRKAYVSPFVIRPLVDRLISFGCLPPVKDTGYIIWWPDMNSPSDLDKANVADKITNAISKYVMGGCDILIEPFHFLTLILGLSDEEAESVIKIVGKDLMKVDPDDEEDDTEPTTARPKLKNETARQLARNGK